MKPEPDLKVRRQPARGAYDAETIHELLDAGFVAHVGIIHKEKPVVIPMIYGREENRIYVHGSPFSRLMGELEKGVDVCITVTHLDGLVLARSAFHHSLNYRSVVVFGNARKVDSIEDKNAALKVISEHMLKGRWDQVRAPTEKELNATLVLAVDLDRASAKIRTGPPKDDPADYDLDIWAGEVPMELRALKPRPDPKLRSGIECPENVIGFSEK